MRTSFDKQVKKDLKREKREKNKVFRVVTFSILGFLAWISLVYFCFLGFRASLEEKSEPMKTEPVKEFIRADYEEDIFQNERWLEKNRQIIYGDPYYKQELKEENVKDMDAYAVFFYQYFDAIIHGDAATYKSCFSPEYPSYHTIPAQFTMQKLYDVTVFRGVSPSEDDKSAQTDLNYVDFEVKYRILENNRSFRSDISSGQESHQMYRLISDESGKLYIREILDIYEESVAEIDFTGAVLYGAGLVILVIVPAVVFTRFYLKRKARKNA